MYKFVLFSISILLVSCRASKGIETPISFDQDTTSVLSDLPYYKVKSITPYGGAYILEVSLNDSSYFVLTENDIISNSLCRSPIKEGELYPLKLEEIDIYKEIKKRPDYDPEKFIPGEYSGIVYNKTSISHSQFSKHLYTSPSLKGLCLLKDSYIPPLPIVKEEIKNSSK